MTKEQLGEALSSNTINNWEYNFCLDIIELNEPTKKQEACAKRIYDFIADPSDEERINKNKRQDEISEITEIDKNSDEATVFEEGYTDAKIMGMWFRKCNCCDKIKKKETEYESEWRKNRRSRRGGQVTYSRRCMECEETVGHKWGNANLKTD